jgi:hypothetical protein
MRLQDTDTKKKKKAFSVFMKKTEYCYN